MLVPTVSVFPQQTPGGHLPLPVCVNYAETARLFYYISYELPQRERLVKKKTTSTAVGTLFEFELIFYSFKRKVVFIRVYWRIIEWFLVL